MNIIIETINVIDFVENYGNKIDIKLRDYF